MATGELLSSPTPHEGGQLTPDLIVKHEGPVLSLGRGVGEPQGTPAAGNDAQLLNLQRADICVMMSRLSYSSKEMRAGLGQKGQGEKGSEEGVGQGMRLTAPSCSTQQQQCSASHSSLDTL